MPCMVASRGTLTRLISDRFVRQPPWKRRARAAEAGRIGEAGRSRRPAVPVFALVAGDAQAADAADLVGLAVDLVLGGDVHAVLAGGLASEVDLDRATARLHGLAEQRGAGADELHALDA